MQQVRVLNFTDDAEVERCVQAIEQVAVDRKAGERDIADITRTLRQVGVVTRGSCSLWGAAPGAPGRWRFLTGSMRRTCAGHEGSW